MSGITNSFPAGGIDEAGVNELIAAATAGGAKAELVSYTGTGTSGESGACSLTFDSPPQIVVFFGYLNANGKFFPFSHGKSEHPANIVYMDALTTSYVDFAGFYSFGHVRTNSHAKKSEDGKTLYWYESSDSGQLNSTKTTYLFLAIG